MDTFTFIGGVLCGLLAKACYPMVKDSLEKVVYRLGEDEKYLLAAARIAQGRLLFASDPGSADPPLLQLKEFPQERPIENLGQVERLFAQGLIEVDDSGVSGRYVLTLKGWNRANKLPPLALVVCRQGDWFNSISRRPRKPLQHG